MSELKRRCIADLCLAALVCTGAALLFIGAAKLPPPRFEPLGSAALPRILGALLVFFAALLALRAGLRLRGGRAVPEAGDSGADPKRGFLVLAALVAYVFAMDVLRVPFIPATTVFVAAAGLAIGARSWANLGIFLALGLGLSFGISTILTRYLYITIG